MMLRVVQSVPSQNRVQCKMTISKSVNNYDPLHVLVQLVPSINKNSSYLRIFLMDLMFFLLDLMFFLLDLMIFARSILTF